MGENLKRTFVHMCGGVFVGETLRGVSNAPDSSDVSAAATAFYSL
jgi:hypothetical protein